MFCYGSTKLTIVGHTNLLALLESTVLTLSSGSSYNHTILIPQALVLGIFSIDAT